MGFRALTHRGLAAATGAALALSAAPAAFAAPASSARSAATVSCVAANPAYATLATKMAADIQAKIRARRSTVGLEVTDSKTQITCAYQAANHFYAASAVKVIILAALLRKAQEQHRSLTANEKYLATRMIEISDNSAASALWDELGVPYIQHFLNLAKMTHTRLNYAWGLTLLTAQDEIELLKLLAEPSTVLTPKSQAYELYLMAHVTASQRWGTPAGAPADVVVHVKNGWLPYPSWQWEINSLGIFTQAAKSPNPARDYEMAILTYDNQSMPYGVTTIESIATVIHHDWNPGVAAAVPPSRPGPGWGVPDETIPASPRS